MPFNRPFVLPPNLYHSVALFLLALANYSLMYSANILLAHTLEVGEFVDYNVAISTGTLLSTLATLGLEKYALRAIPVFRERQDWRRFRSIWQFSLRTILGFSVVLALLLAAVLESILAFYHADYHIAIVVYAGFLPVIALSHYLVEFIAAHRAVLLGVSIYRFLLPVLYLVFLLGIAISLAELSALIAVICYGMAWTTVCFLMWRISSFFIPAHIHRYPTSSRAYGAGWLRASLPLVMNSLMMTIMTSGGLIILELLFPSGNSVGIYAAAAQTGAFISLVGTSTNRYFLPAMAVLIEQRDKQAINELLQKRALSVGGLILLLLSTVYFRGDSILMLFGAHFKAGHEALVIIAVGASVSAFYADIPYYLQFMGFKRTVVTATALATLAMIVLSFRLGPVYGPTGVAAAYMVPVSVLFITLRLISVRHFQRL